MHDPQPARKQNGPPGEPRRRLFLALPLNDPVRDRLETVCTKLRKASQFTPVRMTWVPRPNWHVTLHFLGAVPEPKALELAASLPEITAPFQGFALEMRGLGYFPHKRAPKVFWAGFPEPPEGLGVLQRGLGRALAQRGFHLRGDKFHAHVTLARFKSLKATNLFVKNASPFQAYPFGKLAAERVCLMESHLDPEGARYECLAEGALSAPSDESA